jgi:hypothetical protein
MKIDYTKILRDNMLNVFKEVLLNISKNGLQEDHHLYITFDTNNSKVKIPKWLKEKHPQEMTIVIQYEYWNFIIKKKLFKIGLSFNNIKTNLTIPYDSVISFADPYAKFGLNLAKEEENKEKIKSSTNKTVKTVKKKNNILEFKKISKN